MKSKTLVLLDSHAIIHRAYHALPDFTASSTGEPTGALYGLVAMLLGMVEKLKPDYIVAGFDLHGPTHRHEAYDAYKAGRRENDANLELQLKRALDVFAAFNIPVYSHEGFEADDIIGTIVEKGKKLKIGNSKLDIIIASGDMDTLQLVEGKRVQVYTLKKGINDTILYDEAAVVARYGFSPKQVIDYKGLRGDPSDNIIGVKGIGEKGATELLKEFGTIEKIYKNINKVKPERLQKLLRENEEEALFSKTLATIRTDAPINFELPANFRENFELNKVLELFKTLGFRTLGERVKRVMGAKIEGGSKRDLEVVGAREQGEWVKNSTISFDGADSSSEAKELGLALWCIDSNITNPKVEDVLNFTRANSIEEAKKVIETELDKRSARKVFEEIEKPLLPVVEEMNKLGVKIDREILGKLSVTYHKRLKELEKEIWAHAGGEFNIGSPKALGEVLFTKLNLAGKRQKKTAGGQFSTREEELQKLKDSHPIIQSILDYRELAKLLSTYIDAIPPLLDKKSRLHSTFILSGAATGRMASQAPNLQNIPIRSELGRVIRTAFVAERGYKLVALDYSQIELRLAAILSDDKKLIEIFHKGEDIHKGVAEKIGVSRSEAKTINFGILYGMGVSALQKNLGADRKTAQEFYNNYFSTFAGLSGYLEECKKEAGEKGYTETMFGRRRYFTGFKSPLPYVRAQAERMAINAPIQGTQADIIKIAMRQIVERFPETRLLMQVHDELVFEVKTDEVEKMAKEFKKIMESVMDEKMTKGVPIVAEANVGENWGEMKRI